MQNNHYLKLFLIILPAFILLQSGCAYYNTFYNAKKFYKDAEKDRIEREKKMVVELTEDEKAQRRKTGQATTNVADKPSQQEMQNYQQAIERASRVLEFYPDSKYVDDALLLLGKCFYYRQEYKKAQRKFEEIIQLYPNSEFIPETELLMARTYLGLEEFDEAEDRFLQMSIAKDIPKDIQEEAKFELAGLYFQKQSYERAAENFASSAKEAKNKLIRAMSLYRLGECNIQLGDYKESINLFIRSAKASPNEEFKSQATFKLGEAYSLAEDYDNAIDTYSELLNTEYDVARIPMIKLALAENFQKMGDMTEAINWYLEIIEEHKRTDASARSYYALGAIEEFINLDYKRAKENYDLVRSEFANSLIAPDAKERSDNIKLLLDLNTEIAKLEGRYVETDSLDENADPEQAAQRQQRDDAPINLPADGMWINYAGRHRPPPSSLLDLTESDLQRSAIASQMAATMADSTDSTGTRMSTKPAVLDSAALAELKAKQEKEKIFQLAEKRMALAEVLYFNFDKPDSSAALYKTIIENQIDSSITTSALFSLGYLYKNVLNDSSSADSVLYALIEFNPNSEQAIGARKLLDLPIMEDKIDSSMILFNQAENAYWQDQNVEKAIELYEYIIENFPESVYAPKSAYARAWMYEHVLVQPDQALKLYEEFIESYPETEYIQKIKPRLAAVDKYIQAEEAKQKAIADSIAKAEAAIQDSLNAAAGIDSLGQPIQSDSLSAQASADSLGGTNVKQAPNTANANTKTLELPANVKTNASSSTDSSAAAIETPPAENANKNDQPEVENPGKDKGNNN